ncbi:MAG TPA: SRPBCC family protein [Terriglobales bacterium]|nr:SRPBCC family protein [Terriglobales bacterium]
MSRTSRCAGKGFGAGIAVGIGIGTALWLIPELVGRARRSHIIRLQKSIQIGAPVKEVFENWLNVQNLPRVSDDVREVLHQGAMTHWKVNFGGRDLEWDARIEQLIPNEAIGWKSLRGPKHTGRIVFSPIGDDTLVQLTMNYAPPLRVFRPFVAQMTTRIESVIERVLRDFKASLEGRGPSHQRMRSRSVGPGTNMTESNIERATGTSDFTPDTVDRFGNRANPVDYRRPPDAKY